MQASPRVVLIPRVSQEGGRGDRLHSPKAQEKVMRRAASINEYEVLRVAPEIDISGTLPLARRPELYRAVLDIENGNAEGIMFADRNRADRSVATNIELVPRVEAAGGFVCTAQGEILSHATSDRWFQSMIGSLVAEKQAREAREKAALGQAEAIAEGRVPINKNSVTLGYRRLDSGRWEVDEEKARLTRGAFAYRLDRGDGQPASIELVREWLDERGVKMSYRRVQGLLASRTVLGEISLGSFRNPDAFPAIVDVDTFEDVQALSLPRGRHSQSERLLARQGVLICGTCGGNMVVGHDPRGKYPFYRCPKARLDCSARPTIRAEVVEEYVMAKVHERLDGEDVFGEATLAAEFEAARAEAKQAKAHLDRLTRGFAAAGLTDGDAAAVEELTSARERRDQTAAERDRLRATLAASRVRPDDPDISLEGRRDLIRAVQCRVVVRPQVGTETGLDRVTLTMFDEEPSVGLAV